MKDYPGDIHGQWVALICQRKYELPSVFYLDLWPIAYQFCLTTDPAISEQVQMRPKHDSFYHFMNDFLGSRNLTTLEGSVWKKWRAVFNPGFSASHLMTLVPAMVDETQIFCNVLQKHAEEDNVFRFERGLTSLTVDIIGRVTLSV
jgi:cytochrome P450